MQPHTLFVLLWLSFLWVSGRGSGCVCIIQCMWRKPEQFGTTKATHIAMFKPWKEGGMQKMMKFKDWKNRERYVIARFKDNCKRELFDDKYVFLSTPNLSLQFSFHSIIYVLWGEVCVHVRFSSCLSNKFLSSFLDAFCHWINSSSSNSIEDIFLTCIGIQTQTAHNASSTNRDTYRSKSY